jgi:hypothetical protein
MAIPAALRQDLSDIPILEDSELGAKGVAVANHHTFILDNAGWKRVDAPQAEFKRLADPYGLMNPGKLEHWQARDMRAIA